MLHVRKLRNVPKKRFNDSHWLYTCPQCSPGQRCAITGHHEGIYRCPPVMGPPCGCSGSTRARCAPSHPIRMAAPSGTGAAGGGAAQRSSWPGAQTAGAASTGATRAASASHAVVAFAPWRRQHAWNLHQRAVLVQVPLILNRLLKECCQKNLFFFVDSQTKQSRQITKSNSVSASSVCSCLRMALSAISAPHVR